MIHMGNHGHVSYIPLVVHDPADLIYGKVHLHRKEKYHFITKLLRLCHVIQLFLFVRFKLKLNPSAATRDAKDFYKKKK